MEFAFEVVRHFGRSPGGVGIIYGGLMFHVLVTLYKPVFHIQEAQPLLIVAMIFLGLFLSSFWRWFFDLLSLKKKKMYEM